MINEPTHGDDFRSNYKDIWNRVLNLARETDPNAKLGINDYDVARSDMGQCLLDLVDGYDIDWLGVQSQGFSNNKLTTCGIEPVLHHVVQKPYITM